MSATASPEGLIERVSSAVFGTPAGHPAQPLLPDDDRNSDDDMRILIV